MNKKIESFGNYLLLKKIASGGMAEVFLARPAVREGEGRLLVIKRILPHIANHPDFITMFQREIQTTMGFNHSNVVQLHDFGAANGQPFIAMEYIEGKSLRDITVKLKSKGIKLPVPVGISIVAQAASGLHYAHTYTHKTTGKPLHTIHRDISPHNLILSYDGNLKVIDFGVAKADNSQEHTQTGTVKGKVGYFSPEQLLAHEIDARSDIFSLGIVAWELLTGQRLFVKSSDTEAQIMIKISQCENHVVPPSTYNSDIAPEVDRIILRALEKDPTKRYSDAREFQSELRRVLKVSYPAYLYANTGQMVSLLFAEEMKNERLLTSMLNIHAQNLLVDIVEEDNVAIEAPLARYPINTKLTKKVDGVSSRVSQIEMELKQKAKGRHYLMLALYVVSLFVMKFGDRWESLLAPKVKAREVVLNTLIPKVTTTSELQAAPVNALPNPSTTAPSVLAVAPASMKAAAPAMAGSSELVPTKVPATIQTANPSQVHIQAQPVNQYSITRAPAAVFKKTSHRKARRHQP